MRRCFLIRNKFSRLTLYSEGGSPGLVVMGDDSCSKGLGVQIPALYTGWTFGHFFKLNCCKNCIVCWKKTENKRRRDLFIKILYSDPILSNRSFLISKFLSKISFFSHLTTFSIINRLGHPRPVFVILKRQYANRCEKWPSSKWCWDTNSWPLTT